MQLFLRDVWASSFCSFFFFNSHLAILTHNSRRNSLLKASVSVTLPKHRFAASSPAGVTDAHADPKVRQFSLFSTCAIAVLFLTLGLTVLS